MKQKRILMTCLIWLFAVLEIASLAYYVWIQRQQKGIIHNLERDLILDRNENYTIVGMIVFGILIMVLLVFLYTSKQRNVGYAAVSELKRGYIKEEACFNHLKRPTADAFIVARKENHGKALPVIIDSSLENCFLPKFTITNQNNNLNSYKVLVEQLESRSWTVSDLGRIALLIFESRLLRSEYSQHFNQWMKKFFFLVGRETDCPSEPDKTSYRNFNKSSSNLCSVFSNLKSWYDKAGSDYIFFMESE